MKPPHVRRFCGEVARRCLILVVAAVIAIKLVIGIVMTVFWIAVGSAIAVAVLWALKTIVW